jgi:hypothetical protein
MIGGMKYAGEAVAQYLASNGFGCNGCQAGFANGRGVFEMEIFRNGVFLRWRI